MKTMAAAWVVAVVIFAAVGLQSPLAHFNLQEKTGAVVPAGAFSDYVDETTGTVTRVFHGDARSYNFLQAAPTGGGRDFVAQLTPIETFEPNDADDEISLATGDIVITQPFIRMRNDAYTISYRFHIPRDVLPDEFKHLATLPDAVARNPLQRLIDWLAPTVFAVDGDGISGIISDTFLADTANSSGSKNRTPDVEYQRYREWYQNEVMRSSRAEANMEELERRLVGRTITTGGECTDPEIARARDFVRRARELADDEIRFGKLTPAQQAASGEAQQLAARRAAIDAELRSGRSFTSASAGPSTGSGSGPAASGPAGSSGGSAAAGGLRTAVKVAGNALVAAALNAQLDEIAADSRRWKERLRALKDCAEHPTNPATQRAQREDPNYRRATLNPIQAAEIEEAFVTATRKTAATLNAGATVPFRLLGSSAIGLMGSVEDSLLERRMEETLDKLEECVTRCDLKRTVNVEFRYTHKDESQGTESRSATTDIVGNITLRLVSNQRGYEGTGQGTYAHIASSESKGATCSSRYDEVNKGSLKIDAKAYFSIDNRETGGLSTGKRDRTVLEITTNDAAIAWSSTSNDCGKVTTGDGKSTEYMFDCHIYDVDLKAGGTFTAFKDRNPHSGTCTVTMSPR